MAVKKLGYEIRRRPNDFLDKIENLDAANIEEVGMHIATPVFDGAREEDVIDTIKMAGLNTNGKTRL